MITEFDAMLDRMQYCADPLADQTIAAIVGSGAAEETLDAKWDRQSVALAATSRAFAQWTDNQRLVEWAGPGKEGLAPHQIAALEAYVKAARHLPEWADAAKIARAEALFMDYGPLSLTLLFCASLPECYLVPDLAAVLHVSGQLEKHADYRIRATGAMIVPVMMKGGLTDPAGGGIAQIFKVRLIHATIRHLILRTRPEDALATLGGRQNTPGAGVVAPLPPGDAGTSMHRALFAHGWKTGEDGLPCNQEELAYTLLTFSYVYLRGLRALGLGFARADEESTLHAWNVVGHMLGIERELLVDTMAEAEALYAAMQARGRADRTTKNAIGETEDPRPALGRALIKAMANEIPLGLLKSVPVLMTRFLCGPAASRDLGLDTQVSWFARALFAVGMTLALTIDKAVRLVFPQFSIARLIARILGYHLMTKLMMSLTRPLNLPEHLLNNVNAMMGHWSEDHRAPGWINALEDWATVKGRWHKST